jgi:hypothetical protein
MRQKASTKKTRKRKKLKANEHEKEVHTSSRLNFIENSPRIVYSSTVASLQSKKGGKIAKKKAKKKEERKKAFEVYSNTRHSFSVLVQPMATMLR